MSGYTLTTGALEKIMAGQTCDRPVLQVLGQKKIAGTSGPDRYRLLLSDGQYSQSSAMLATQLNDKITSEEMDTNSIIRLDKYICNPIHPDRRVMIILEVAVLASGKQVGGKIGNPQNMRAGNEQNTSGNPNQGESKPAAAAPPATAANNYSSYNKPAQPVTAAPANKAGGAGFQGGTTFQRNANNNVPAPATKQFYGNNPPQATGYQNRTNTMQQGTSSLGDTPNKVHPISSLTPYQNRWTIKVRVTQKAAMKTWSNSRGEGKLFSMTLVDESGEIRATAFQAEADKFYNIIELNKVYMIRKASLKTADKRFSSLNNDYEMTFNQETEVIPCDDASDLPTLSFSFVPINELESHPANETIDIIGVVKSVDDLKLLTSKANKELKKRDITLVDQSQVQVRLTVWGNDAENFNAVGKVLAIKGAKLSDWGGRSLSAISNSQLIIDPDIPEGHRLRGWYDVEGSTASYSEFKREGGLGAGAGGSANWKTFLEVKAQNLGQDKADYFTTKGTIVFLRKENCMYQACPLPDCNKKVVDQGNGSYRCEKCDKQYPNFKWRMILSLNLADFTDNQWVTCFQDTAETVLGAKSEEIGRLKDQDMAGFDHLFAEANFKSFIFKMRAKMETFNDETRLKTVCVQVTPINYKEYNQKLITDIETMLKLH